MRRWWRDWQFIDRFGIAVTITTVALIIALMLATCANSK